MSRLLWRSLTSFVDATAENSTTFLANRLAGLYFYRSATLTKAIRAGDLNSLAVILARLNYRTDSLFFDYLVFSAMRRSRGTDRLALHNRDKLTLLNAIIPCPLKGHLSSACWLSFHDLYFDLF
jgi:hypothetical protein